jgi:hypothetical protein
MLFKDPERFLELYSAVSGKTFAEGAAMREATLSDVLYINRKNDIAYEIGDCIVVFLEHQSTVNPNIALRMLFYAVDTYKSMIIRPESVYGSTKIWLRRPEFYVIYNGTVKIPENYIVRLSDVFEPRGDGKPHPLDLWVTIYNINIDGNPELLKKCVTLSQYEIFIERVRKYEETLSREEAMKRAIKECIREGVLSDFLTIHGAEVMNMLYAELDMAKLQEVWKGDGRLEGRAEGIGIGMARGMEKGMEIGMARGREEVFALLEKGFSIEEAKKMCYIGRR